MQSQPTHECSAHIRERGCSAELLSKGTKVLKKVLFSTFIWNVAGTLLDNIFCENHLKLSIQYRNCILKV